MNQNVYIPTLAGNSEDNIFNEIWFGHRARAKSNNVRGFVSISGSAATNTRNVNKHPRTRATKATYI